MSTRSRFSGHAILSATGRLTVRHPVLVIVVWLAMAAVMLLTIPSLAEVSQRNPPDFLPKGAPVLAAGKQMQEAFKEGSAGNFIAVVLSNEHGLTQEDEGTYRAVVDRLKADVDNVKSTQDFVTIPELRQAMTSRDGKAWNLPVMVQGTFGTGPGQRSYRAVVKNINEAVAGSSLHANVVGPAATFEDVSAIGIRDQHIIELSTVILVLTILILVYRSLVAMLIPLFTIGIALVVAQQVVAVLGLMGVMGLSPQTIMLMTGMMVGAGVDYSVFLFSRYQEHVRTGMDSDNALTAALVSIGEVIAGSAGTVAITFMALTFATLGVFSSVGPALAVTVAVGFLASITLLPAFIALAGRRNWVKPRKDITGRFWRRSGINIVRRPWTNLIASLVILIGLAACATLVQFNYDDRKNLPQDSDSMLAYEAMNSHFPISNSMQQFLLIQSPDTDLRSPKGLGDMEEMARRVGALPNIDAVRGITRPNGEMIREGRATYQAGEVGSKLGQVSTYISQNNANLDLLGGGSKQMADVLNQIRNTLVTSVASVRGLAAALDQLSIQYGGATTLDEIDKTATLLSNMHQLGESMGISIGQITDVYSWANPILTALNVSPQCSADPNCVASRADLQKVIDNRNDPLLISITELGRELQEADGDQSLTQSVQSLSTTLKQATAAARSLGLSEQNGIERRLNAAVQGANLLADSSRALSIGTQLLVDQTKQMGGGLNQASAFLEAMRRDAADPPMSGFYIPPQILTQPEFEKAAKLFISEDGHTARYLVQTALDPFGTAAMDQIDEIVKTANDSRANTSLANANVAMVGFTPVQNDIRDYYNGDIRFIVITTLIVVFLILVALLRAIVAPLYLVASVVLSYMSALGISVIFFQFILGKQIFWNVPGMTFLVLVAVGADYNLLLISRIREEAHLGIRAAVIRTVGATGGVITSAGLIFAASMLALTVSSIGGIVQIGFIIGVGLLLDTFLVRTVTVPAMCVLVGDRNWWPSKPPRKSFGAKNRSKPKASTASSVSPAAASAVPLAERTPGSGGSTASAADDAFDPDDDASTDTDFAAACHAADLATTVWRTKE